MSRRFCARRPRICREPLPLSKVGRGPAVENRPDKPHLWPPFLQARSPRGLDGTVEAPAAGRTPMAWPPARFISGGGKANFKIKMTEPPGRIVKHPPEAAADVE
jgi:hypothetical protein